MLVDVVHIKETFATRMDPMTFIGLKQEHDGKLQFYACMADGEFASVIEQKMENTSTARGKDNAMVANVRNYLLEKVPLIAAQLKLKVVTDLQTDRLLTIRQASSSYVFVYFGAVTADWIHVACWLRIELDGDIISKSRKSPAKLFFWMMGRSYTQPAEALSKLVGTSSGELANLLDLTEGIEYP